LTWLRPILLSELLLAGITKTKSTNLESIPLEVPTQPIGIDASIQHSSIPPNLLWCQPTNDTASQTHDADSLQSKGFHWKAAQHALDDIACTATFEMGEIKKWTLSMLCPCLTTWQTKPLG
jgi:hypothetical protein